MRATPRSVYCRLVQKSLRLRLRSTGDYSPLGAGRKPPVPGKLTADDKAFIAMIRERDDPNYDEKQFITMMSRGNTEDDWPREETKSGT